MLNQRSLDRLKGVKQILVDVLNKAHDTSPYPFEIPPDGGKRTAERQNELFKKGASKLDGYNKIGKHQLGLAADIYLNKEVGMAMWDKVKLEKVARHIQEVAEFEFNLKIVWGGDWKWKDMPHFEI